jgi:hypothetical protein
MYLRIMEGSGPVVKRKTGPVVEQRGRGGDERGEQAMYRAGAAPARRAAPRGGGSKDSLFGYAFTVPVRIALTFVSFTLP